MNKPILFVQTAFLGDLCLSAPLIKELRRVYPDNQIWLVTRRGLSSFFVESKLVDCGFEVSKGSWSSYRNLINQWRTVEFEVIVTPHESFTTARFVYNLKSQKKISYHHWWNGLFFQQRFAKPPSGPEVIKQLQLLRGLDENVDWLNEAEKQEWNIPEADLKSPSERLLGKIDHLTLPKFSQKTVAIFPGSVWETKKWKKESFAELVKLFAEAGWQILLMGAKDELLLCQQIVDLANVNSDKVQIRAGKDSISQTLNWLAQCSLVVSNDSGGAHLASLVNCPTVAIFGPTVVKQGFRPWVTHAAAVGVDGLSCRPCGKHGHQKCPIGTHECMTRVSAIQVFTTATRLIENL